MRLLLLLVVLAASTAQATQSSVTVAAHGIGSIAETTSGTLRLHSDGDWQGLDVAGALTGRLVDDQVEYLDPATPAVDPYPGLPRHDRIETPFAGRGAATLILRESTPDMVVLVLPRQAGLRVDTAASWQLSSSDETVLERSHYFDPASGDPRAYEYLADDVLNWTSEEEATWEVNGTFDVYVWGASFVLKDANGERELRAGHWTASESLLGRTEHNVFLELEVTGVLRAATRGPANLLAPVLILQPLTMNLTDAHGTVETADSRWVLDGAAELTGGQFEAAYGDSGIELKATQRPIAVSGIGAEPLPNAAPPVLWLPILLVLGGVICLVLMGGVVRRKAWFQAPTGMLEWLGEPLRRPWLALAILRLAVFANPRDGRAWGLYGHVLKANRRFHDSMGAYLQAYHRLEARETRGIAAYQLARANALMDRPDEAGRWLIAALDLNRGLLANARLSQDFKHIQSSPQFRRRIGAAFDLGLDLDAP